MTTVRAAGIKGAGPRFQTNSTPAVRQIAAVSSSARETNVGEMSDAAATLMVSVTAIAVINILSAIDGCERRKFDVRNRKLRDALNLEIDRHDVFAKRHAVLRNGHVTRMFLIGVERRTIDERNREAGVVRAGRADDVGANLEAGDSVYIVQGRQPGAVVVLCLDADAHRVLETDEVNQAHSSSPSMSSSATSTTTLWISILNHSRNDARSRFCGHVVSSSVHAPS